MKRIFTLIVFAFFCIGLQAQIVITEISYNPPEGGQDSLEYVEIHNAGATMADLSGYTLGGADYEFPAGSNLDAGAYMVLAKSASAMQAVFGISVTQWTDGAFSNGGEEVSISDASGTVVDNVDFGDDTPWPSMADGTDGAGSSIELCDATSDNNMGFNWRAADNDTGATIDGKAVKGTPGAANTVTCTTTVDHTITATPNNVFSPDDITINVGETVQWSNSGGNHNVNGSTATFPSNPEGFTNGAASGATWTFDHTFGIVGVYDYQCDPHAGLGMTGRVTVIDPNAPTFPSYDIGTINSVNATGVADSIGVTCTVSGIVHSINFNGGGLTFTLIDSNMDGLGVYNQSNNLGYNVTPGDVVTIEGEITQFRGLTQIEASSVTMTGTDVQFSPTLVTGLSEGTESQVIQILNLSFVDDADWLGDGSSFNVPVTDGTNTFAMRIDDDTEMASDPIFPCSNGTMSVIGVGSQFDFDEPFDSGYQFLPRNWGDFLCTTSIDDLSLEGNISLSPNPVNNVLNINTEVEIAQYIITDLMGRKIETNSYRSSIDVQHLNAGTYFITLLRGDKLHTIKFVK